MRSLQERMILCSCRHIARPLLAPRPDLQLIPKQGPEVPLKNLGLLLFCLFKLGSFKGDIDVEVDVDIDRCFGCFKLVSKSVQTLLSGMEAVLVVTLIILKYRAL